MRRMRATGAGTNDARPTARREGCAVVIWCVAAGVIAAGLALLAAAAAVVAGVADAAAELRAKGGGRDGF